MDIQATITYAQDDQPSMSTAEIADALFKAMGADEDKDTCTVQVFQSGTIGGGAQAAQPPAALGGSTS